MALQLQKHTDMTPTEELKKSVEKFLCTRCVREDTEEETTMMKEIYPIFEGTYKIDKTSLVSFVAEQIALAEAKKITEDTSDGYHTFKELYEFRKLYNAGFFNALSDAHVHKSKRHHDGEECFGGGWFIVIATLPTGQISNHYEMKDWGLFHCEERERADKWDGHTTKDVVERLTRFLSQEVKDTQTN